jgi:hypothetical protein
VASVAEKVRASIFRRKLGVPFACECLYNLGSRAAVRQALLRLTEDGLIQRVARGVYVRPRVSEYVGKVPPEPLLIAKAKTKIEGESIIVSGAEAARRLGLSTQMSVRDVFLSTGVGRKFKALGRPVVIRHVSARKVKPNAGKVTLASAALSYLGRDLVTSDVIQQIRNKLTASEFEELRAYSRTMPEWIQKQLEGAIRG